MNTANVDRHTVGTKTKPISRTQAERLMRMATLASLIVAVTLFASKLLAWFATGSVALFGALVDSGVDIFASAFNFVAVRHALKPPDAEHRFGHGKAEALAALAQGAFIGGSALFLLFQSAERFYSPEPIAAFGIGVAVSGFAILATLGLVLFQNYVIRQTQSLAISADELHFRSDLLLNGSVVIALVLAGPWFGFGWIDPLVGCGIAVYIGWSAASIALKAYDQLMDREFDPAERQKIIDTVLAHKDVISLHELRTRRAGRDVFIQFHLELEPSLTLLEAHLISDAVEACVLEIFPEADVIIHQDPAGLDEGHPRWAQVDID